MADKTEWLQKLRHVISSKGGQVKGDTTPSMRHSLSDGSLVSNFIALANFYSDFLILLIYHVNWDYFVFRGPSFILTCLIYAFRMLLLIANLCFGSSYLMI